MESTFRASTKYADWKGTSSADDHDEVKARHYFTKKGIMKAGEFLIGIETIQHETHETSVKDPLWVNLFFVEKVSDYETVAAQVAAQKPLKVRKVHTEIPIADFFGLFKRFEIAISPGGLIDGLQLEYSEE